MAALLSQDLREQEIVTIIAGAACRREAQSPTWPYSI
jgi:hypothetical protein